MKNIGIRTLLALTLLFCSFQCNTVHTSFYITNMTDEVIYIHSVHRFYGTHKATLKPGESLEIAKLSEDGAMNLFAVVDKDLEVAMGTEEKGLLRFWTIKDSAGLEAVLKDCNAKYFRADGVRQLHNNESEWYFKDNGDDYEYTFHILPEDLIPLEEFIKKEGDTEE